MRSTFMGLETNKRGLYTQQSALYTTGHNINNANTLGYSRQRVNMETTPGFPGVGLNAGTMPGHLGTGVQASSIQRIRDGFVDQQFRGESTKLGYWESRSNAIGQMEDVLAEPSAYGLQKSLSDFWVSLQTLAANPENGGAREVVLQQGSAVADSFNYMHKSLKEIQTNLGQEIGVSAKDINSILEQIGDLNRQISEVEPNGYMPNDLYDRRDMLLDKLATYVPIETTYVKSGGNSLAIAEGSVTVRIKTNGEPITVLEGKEYSKIAVNGENAEGNPTGPMTGFNFVGGPASGQGLTVGNMQVAGKMKSLVNSYGYENGTVGGKGLYPDMIKELNKMAKEFAEEFNIVQEGGTDLDGAKGDPFFGPSTGVEITAETIKVIITDARKIAASDSPVGSAEVGNAKNAQKLSEIQFKAMAGLGNATIQSYFSGVVGKLGVEGEQAKKLAFNSATLLGAVSNRRDSISSVSLDEEMTDMIRFQQAYNASARMITVIDETLDKIINGMGRAGM